MSRARKLVLRVGEIYEDPLLQIELVQHDKLTDPPGLLYGHYTKMERFPKFNCGERRNHRRAVRSRHFSRPEWPSGNGVLLSGKEGER